MYILDGLANFDPTAQIFSIAPYLKELIESLHRVIDIESSNQLGSVFYFLSCIYPIIMLLILCRNLHIFNILFWPFSKALNFLLRQFSLFLYISPPRSGPPSLTVGNSGVKKGRDQEIDFDGSSDDSYQNCNDNNNKLKSTPSCKKKDVRVSRLNDKTKAASSRKLQKGKILDEDGEKEARNDENKKKIQDNPGKKKKTKKNKEAKKHEHTGLMNLQTDGVTGSGASIDTNAKTRNQGEREIKMFGHGTRIRGLKIENTIETRGQSEIVSDYLESKHDSGHEASVLDPSTTKKKWEHLGNQEPFSFFLFDISAPPTSPTGSKNSQIGTIPDIGIAGPSSCQNIILQAISFLYFRPGLYKFSLDQLRLILMKEAKSTGQNIFDFGGAHRLQWVQSFRIHYAGGSGKLKESLDKDSLLLDLLLEQLAFDIYNLPEYQVESKIFSQMKTDKYLNIRQLHNPGFMAPSMKEMTKKWDTRFTSLSEMKFSTMSPGHTVVDGKEYIFFEVFKLIIEITITKFSLVGNHRVDAERMYWKTVFFLKENYDLAYFTTRKSQILTLIPSLSKECSYLNGIVDIIADDSFYIPIMDALLFESRSRVQYQVDIEMYNAFFCYVYEPQTKKNRALSVCYIASIIEAIKESKGSNLIHKKSRLRTFLCPNSEHFGPAKIEKIDEFFALLNDQLRMHGLVD